MPRKPIFKDNNIIIDTAFEIIKDDGFKNFTTRKLASNLGVSKNAVFNYFPTKEDIITKVVEKFFNIMTKNVLEKIKTKKNYYKENLFYLYPVYADILYDMVIRYGDVYKLAHRDFLKTFEKNTAIEIKFKLFAPIFSFLFENFKFTDYPMFNSQDFLDKNHLLFMFLSSMDITESNRTNKIGKDEHMRLFHKAWLLITEKSKNEKDQLTT
jgi:AcrR family transcriptional regulator